jgi:hypothetical protein
VRIAYEAIVAAASVFGPFDPAFIAYVKGVVFTWLRNVSQAVRLFAKVLSVHSASQPWVFGRDVAADCPR